MNARKYEVKRQVTTKSSKFHKEGNFDFLTASHEIKIDEL